MKNKKIFSLCMAAMFAALIAALTYFPKIPIPGGGYVHLGDSMIYIAATFLPTPYALCAAAIGGGLADIISGFAIYAPFTVVAKALLTIAFTSHGKMLTRRNALAAAIGLVITPAIYFVADAILAKSFGAAVPGIIWNVAQAAASIAVFVVIAAAFDKMQIKNKLKK